MKSFIVALLLSQLCHAADLQLPRGLNSNDRVTLVQILGFGSQSKLLSSPVPLGGDQGFELGLADEDIPISQLKTLGSGTAAPGDYSYLSLVMGKGLPANVDVFVEFTPVPQSQGAFGYGGQLRWGFLDVETFPGIFSFVAHTSGMNYSNLLVTRTSGADLVFTAVWRELSAFAGAGYVNAVGSFFGGTDSITADRISVSESSGGYHGVVGLNYKYRKSFLCAEVDQVTQPVYAAKVGYRF